MAGEAIPAELADQVAIVTGAGRNIGQRIAETFADAGASVVAADIDADRAASTASAIRDAGGDAAAITVDVAKEADVRSLVSETRTRFGPVDVLVNNVAVTDRADLLELDVDTFDRVVAVNLRGAFLCIREAARSMAESNGGAIVNLGTTSAHRGRASSVAYATTKAGILNLTRSAARALAPHGIRVNTLSPTRTGSRTLDPWAQPDGALDTDFDDRVRAEIPVGRLGTPQDQANACLFLVSARSAFVTGTEFVVDGGRSA